MSLCDNCAFTRECKHFQENFLEELDLPSEEGGCSYKTQKEEARTLGEKPLKKVVLVGSNSLLSAGKSLLKRGEITPEQYREMERRNAKLSKEAKNDIVIIGRKTNDTERD